MLQLEFAFRELTERLEHVKAKKFNPPQHSKIVVSERLKFYLIAEQTIDLPIFMFALLRKFSCIYMRDKNASSISIERRLLPILSECLREVLAKHWKSVYI